MDKHDRIAAACERQRERLFPEPGSEPESNEPDPDEAYERMRQNEIDYPEESNG